MGRDGVYHSDLVLFDSKQWNTQLVAQGVERASDVGYVFFWCWFWCQLSFKLKFSFKQQLSFKQYG